MAIAVDKEAQKIWVQVVTRPLQITDPPLPNPRSPCYYTRLLVSGWTPDSCHGVHSSCSLFNFHLQIVRLCKALEHENERRTNCLPWTVVRTSRLRPFIQRFVHVFACFANSKPFLLFHLFCLRSLVEVRLHEPLWKVQFSPDDVAIEVLTLCSQLEPLCKKEYAVRNVFVFSCRRQD